MTDPTPALALDGPDALDRPRINRLRAWSHDGPRIFDLFTSQRSHGRISTLPAAEPVFFIFHFFGSI